MSDKKTKSGRNVFHVVPYVYRGTVRYTWEQRHYSFDEDVPVLPGEIMHSEDFKKARAAMAEENRKVKIEARERRERRKSAELQAKLDFLAGRT